MRRDSHKHIAEDLSSPIAPASLVPLGLAGFVLPLCTNVSVTASSPRAAFWLLSPRKVCDLRGVYFLKGTGNRRHQEWYTLPGRSARLSGPLRHPPPRAGHCWRDRRAGLRI
jgi:hypothetical protein